MGWERVADKMASGMGFFVILLMLILVQVVLIFMHCMLK